MALSWTAALSSLLVILNFFFETNLELCQRRLLASSNYLEQAVRLSPRVQPVASHDFLLLIS